MSQRSGLLFIISAPSGTGKTSVCKELLKCMPDLVPSISYTTRLPRADERDGVDYWFVTPQTFQEKLDKGEFAEWAVVHGHLYGTPVDRLKKAIGLGKDVLLAIDVQGAERLGKAFPRVITIFLLPPSWEILKERIRERRANSMKDVEQRLTRAREEVTHGKDYDYLVINKDLATAVEELRAIIIAERCRTAHVLPREGMGLCCREKQLS